MRRRWAPARASGPPVVTVLTVPPVILWAFALPLHTRVEDTAAAFHSLANITALLGTGAFAVNLLIGARLPFAERCWGAFDQMYRLHRTVGLAALMLLVSHATLLAANRATRSFQASLELFLPNAGWAVFAGVIGLAGMIAAVALTVLRRMRHETFIWVQRSFGLIFLVSIVHVMAQPGALESAPTLYLLALSALAGVSFLYRSVFGRFLVRRSAYRVEAVDRLDPGVAELTLTPEGRPLRFRPGQFAFFTFLDGVVSDEPHPFSIASSPRDPSMRVVVKALGDYTTDLMNIRPGARARVEGPYGRFSYLDVSNPRQIWIAGGIGITPFLSMARSLDPVGSQIDLYYCTEQAEQAYFQSELFEIGDRDRRFRVIPVRTVSLGHISAEDILGVSPDLVEIDILLCGPPAMNRNLIPQFNQIGMPEDRIHFEDFGFLEGLR
jgi:predicted ferric reductase